MCDDNGFCEDEWWEEFSSSFTGECTCLHDQEVHSWGSCGQKDPQGFECACEAGWEE
jgi:hypothetical protein